MQTEAGKANICIYYESLTAMHALLIAYGTIDSNGFHIICLSIVGFRHHINQ